MVSVWKPMFLVSWHTVAIYLFLIVMFRLVGRRQLSQLNAIDLVIIVTMGSAVETSMVAGDTSLPAGLVSAATLLLANRSIAWVLSRSLRFRRIVGGEPMLLIKEGQFLDERLRRASLTREDVLEAMRERDVSDVDHVKFAVLEINGTITVIPADAKTHCIPCASTSHQRRSSPASAE